MAILREVVSSVRSSNKLLSADNIISDRVVARHGRYAASLLIKREANLRKLWDTDTIFTDIPCIEMIKVPLAECCNYKSGKKITRSKYQLPLIGEGNYRYLVQGPFDIEGTSAYTWVDPNRYINLLKLNTGDVRVYCWIKNRYLYTTSENLELLSLNAYLEGDLDPRFLYPDCECSGRVEINPCLNPLDMDFKCPGYLLKQVIDLTVEELLKTYFKMIPDNTAKNEVQQK